MSREELTTAVDIDAPTELVWSVLTGFEAVNAALRGRAGSLVAPTV
jgi:hypothetical protein